MNGETRHVYEFGVFRLDPTARLLLREDKPVALTPKVFDTLLLLVQHHRQLLEKEQLMTALWPDNFVEENNLTYNISTLRKALGEKATDHLYIITVPGRGYRFVAEVREEGGSTDESASTEPSAPLPVHRNAKSKVVIAVGLLLVFSGSLLYWLASKSCGNAGRQS